MKKVFKWGLTVLGLIIFIFCICNNIDGVGRFACILFATVFTVIGSALRYVSPRHLNRGLLT